MADASRRRPHNATGLLFVDSTCIDCETCMWMAPETFAEADGQSAVHHQPDDDAAWQRALRALVSCPTASIGVEPGGPKAAQAAVQFPHPVAGSVHHLGYHSESSFGATSYLIQRPDGNIMVDAPRWAPPLVRNLEALGGVSRILFTHRDDVADAARYAAHFRARRTIHADDLFRGLDVEDSWTGSEAVDLGGGLTMVPTPGHTRGHACFHLAQEGGVLFTGDHLHWEPDARQVRGWPGVCWYDWPTQVASARRLLEWDFEWLLPGHGWPVHLPRDQMREALAEGVAWMERAQGRRGGG